MPHDRNGNILNVGDTVMVPCRIKAIHLTEDYCNIDIETERPMPPTDRATALTLNSKQTVKPWANERGDLIVYSPVPPPADTEKPE
jgi:hypothetical protein